MNSKQPLVQLFPVQASEPSLNDNTGDLDRLTKCLAATFHARQITTPFYRLAEVAHNFRQSGFKGTAVVNILPERNEIVDFLPDAPRIFPAMALDLGTTHLEASLVDLLSGKILARANKENSQINHGVDILSRIHFATGSNCFREHPGLNHLHQKVIGSVNELAEDLTGQIDISCHHIRALSVSGNTTMVHFFLKLNPYHICREPYIPVVNKLNPFAATDLNLDLHPAAPVWIMPSVGSYFGGDLISGILATGMDRKHKTCMLIDVGTNAEVVIGNRDWLIACAGAAGPALEGGVVQMGMRAGPGAIEHVHINLENGNIDYSTIDGGPARGLCGSGLIDLVAALYLTRVIDIRGKFRNPPLDTLCKRMQKNNGDAFIIVPPEKSATGKAITLTQQDLDALMRSKAAMYSILTTLINQVGLSFADLDQIYVAGAFGRHIEPKQAITLGMLPDLPLAIYKPVGNSSLAGAETILLDNSARKRCDKVVNNITYLELNVNQEFMIRFSGSRFIPHTDQTLFPSVPFFTET